MPKISTKKKSQLIKDLRSVGVQGLGLEPTCIHLDWRNDTNCADTDEFGKYIVFEWDGKSSTVIYAKKIA